MDNKNADDFNVFSFDEFMNFTISDMDNAGVLEVVASGMAGDIEGPTPIVSPATSSPPDVIHKKATVDEHGFTEEDYDRLIENGDMSAILEDEVKEEAEPIKVPLIVEESMSVDKKLDFPLEPTEMTFELLRDWTMIRDGRKDALEEELEARLKDRLEELSANEEGATNGKMTAAFQSFLNAKLETYSKLGKLEEIKKLTQEHSDTLDYVQADRCGVTLIGRLCVWPCGKRSNVYCQIIDFLISKCSDQSDYVNRQSIGSGTTALMIAAKMGDLCKVETFLKRGATVNLENRDGHTALTIAAERGHFDVVAALLVHGANTEGTTLESPKALELAERNDHLDVVGRVLDHAANLSKALRAASSQLFSDLFSIEAVATPIFCMNLRESTSFSVEFVPYREAFEDKPDRLNLLFIACIKKNARGKFRCQKNTVIKTVRLNGTKQDSVVENDNSIKVVTMESLRPGARNCLKLRLKHVNKSNDAKILLQGFVCDFSVLAKTLDTPTSGVSSPPAMTPSDLGHAMPIPTSPLVGDDVYAFFDMNDVLANRENFPPSSLIEPEYLEPLDYE